MLMLKIKYYKGGGSAEVSIPITGLETPEELERKVKSIVGWEVKWEVIPTEVAAEVQAMSVKDAVEPVKEEVKKASEEVICPECEKPMKSEFGLKLHMTRKHK